MKAISMILQAGVLLTVTVFFLPIFVRGLIDLCKVLMNPKKFDEVYDQFIEREEKRWK